MDTATLPMRQGIGISHKTQSSIQSKQTNIPTNIMSSLLNKVALVTGGGSGIGRGIAKVLAQNGAKVVVAGRRAAPLEATQEIIGSGNCSIFAGDVSDESSCKQLVNHVIDTEGSIDILVNNAGIEGPPPDFLETMSVDDYDKIMDINVRSQFLLCKEVIPHMKERSVELLSQFSSFEEVTAARPHAGSIINLT